MRIALLTGDLSNKGAGVKEVVEGLSRELSSLGHDILVLGLETPEWRDGDCDLWQGAPARACAVTGPRSLGFSPEMDAKLASFDADIVHLHGIWQYPSKVAVSWSRRTGRPIVISAHGMLHPAALAQANLKKRVARFLYVDQLLSEAATLVATAQEEIEHFRSFGLRQKIVHQPNGVAFPPVLKRIQDTSPHVDRNMLFLGRFHHTKNLMELLDAWAQLHDETKLGHWTLTVVGWGPASEESLVKRRIQDLRAKGMRISLSPALFGAKKSEMLRSSDAFILPSLNEAFPVTILEAWAAGLPTLISSHCNMDFALEAGAAHLVRTSAKEMAEDILAFLNLPSATQVQMGTVGREIVRQNYTWQSVAKRYETVYEQALKAD